VQVTASRATRLPLDSDPLRRAYYVRPHRSVVGRFAHETEAPGGMGTGAQETK